MGQSDLQQFISDHNPYTQNMTLENDYKTQTTLWDGWYQQPKQFIYWYFGDVGGPQHLARISRAIRVPYTYVKNGQTVTEHVLIGFEGAGGY